MSMENPNLEWDAMRQFGLDPENPADQQEWANTTPVDGYILDYTKDSYEIGGTQIESQATKQHQHSGTPATRSEPPFSGRVPGAELSPERSAELQKELADIRWAEMGAAGPGVIGGRPRPN